MIQYKSEEEIALIRESAEILGRAHGLIASRIKPGVTTLELDELAYDFITKSGGKPSFKGYSGFPYTLCVSVNENVVHGFPSDTPLKEGDIVSIDCGVYYKGFHSDSAFTYPIGTVSDEVMNLLKRTKKSLYLGIEQAKLHNSIGDIGFHIQRYARTYNYGVVKELVGHGLGRNLHEAPEVPNYGLRGRGPKIRNGLVIAIEPMINLGTAEVVQEDDGWTIRTRDRKPSAHFEHTVAIVNGKTEVLTTHKYIEEYFKF
ncbi:methionine aminopeptidase [Fulvitalea axinellae]|uniref:Methionine aminopeptidase n=1 Tax=Fulvitalea axinellae TaxID=1182444 RepID=A0AAU9D4L1_9BACT|nr:methionine aminopeptidase [Fulvitalea axinellae]